MNPDPVKPTSRKWLQYQTLYQKLFPFQASGLRWLPWHKVMPEHYRDLITFLPEHMLCVLAAGGWVKEWKPRVRILIANRLRNLREVPGFYPEPWEGAVDTLLTVQFTGGTFAERAKLKELIRWSRMNPESTTQHRVLAKLAESLLKDPEWDALMYPLWWIRVNLTHTDVLPAFGWTKARREQQVQKDLLVKILHSPVPPGVF